MKEPAYKVKFRGKDIPVYNIGASGFHALLDECFDDICLVNISNIRGVWDILDTRDGNITSVKLDKAGNVTARDIENDNEEEQKFNGQDLKDNPTDQALRLILEFEAAMFSQRRDIGVEAEEILKARKELLDSSLKRLGFSKYMDVFQGKIQEITYVSLRDLVSQFLLDNSLSFVRRVQNYDGNNVIMARLPDDMKPEEVFLRYDKAQKCIVANNNSLDMQEDLINGGAEACPNLMKNIGKRFDKNGTHEKAVKQLALLYLIANADLLPYSERQIALELRKKLEATVKRDNNEAKKWNHPLSLEQRILIENRSLFEEAIGLEELFARQEINGMLTELPTWVFNTYGNRESAAFAYARTEEIQENGRTFIGMLDKLKNPFVENRESQEDPIFGE